MQRSTNHLRNAAPFQPFSYKKLRKRSTPSSSCPDPRTHISSSSPGISRYSTESFCELARNILRDTPRQRSRAGNRDTSVLARARESRRIYSERLGSRDRKMSGSRQKCTDLLSIWESVTSHSSNSLGTLSETRHRSRAVNRDTSVLASARNSWRINSERLGSRDGKSIGSFKT